VSGGSRGKSGLIDDLMQAGRRLSLATILFHQAVADRLGLNPTDHKCIDLLSSAGEMTAGDLAEATGLTTGAITGVIDRLEAAGFVRRDDDPKDRRRVVLRLVAKRYRDIARLFEPFGAAFAELGARYSERELATIVDFMTRSGLVLREATRGLRDRPAGPSRGKPRAGRPRRRAGDGGGSAT
jgi:DNA-binding MarR family transcriptional regulator